MIQKKVIIIANAPTPYRIPLYSYLDKKIDNFQVWFLSEIENHREWKINKDYAFSNMFIKGFSINLIKGHFDSHINFVFFKLVKEKPDVVITTGYDQIAFWQAFFYCKLFGKKYILFNGTILITSRKLHGMIGFLKRLIVRHADAFVTYGAKATEYLKYLKAPNEKIFTGCNTVDIIDLKSKAEKFEADGEIHSLKKEYEYDKIFLVVSRLVKYKGIEFVIDAVKKINNQDNHKSFCVLIVGGGMDEEFFKEKVEEAHVNNIFFIGNIQPEVVYKYYTICDFTIFPSQFDIWGLVVNESLICGKYVICTKKCGAGYDLIKHRENGVMIDFTNCEEVMREMRWCLKNDVDKKNIVNSVLSCDIENYGNSFLEAIQT